MLAIPGVTLCIQIRWLIVRYADSSQALFEKTARTRQASPLPGGENSSIPSQPATKKLSSLDTKPSDYILPPVNRVTKPLVSVPPFVPLGPEERTALRKPYSHSTVPVRQSSVPAASFGFSTFGNNVFWPRLLYSDHKSFLAGRASLDSQTSSYLLPTVG